MLYVVFSRDEEIVCAKKETYVEWDAFPWLLKVKTDWLLFCDILLNEEINVIDLWCSCRSLCDGLGEARQTIMDKKS